MMLLKSLMHSWCSKARGPAPSQPEMESSSQRVMVSLLQSGRLGNVQEICEPERVVAETMLLYPPTTNKGDVKAL